MGFSLSRGARFHHFRRGVLLGGAFPVLLGGLALTFLDFVALVRVPFSS